MSRKLSPGERNARSISKKLNKKPGNVRKEILDMVTQVAKASKRKKK